MALITFREYEGDIMNCPKCKYELTEDLNFCIKCGHQFISSDESELKIINYKKTRFYKNPTDIKKYAIPLLSGIGLMMIIFSLLTIFEIQIDNDNVYTLIYGGYTISAVFFILSIVLYNIDRFDKSIITTMLIISESISFYSSFMLDIVERNTGTKYILLVTSISVASIAIISGRFLRENNYQMIHRVIGIYIAWITIFYLGGSSLVSPVVYTLAILIFTSVFMIVNLYHPSLPVMGSFAIIEFIVFLNTTVINTSYLFYILIFHIVSIPLILILYEKKITLDEFFRSRIKLMVTIYFIPLLSMLVAMSNGALVSPYPHIVLAIFGSVWTVYFIMMSDNKHERDNSMLAAIVTIVLYLSLFVYALNVRTVDLIVMFIGVIFITAILRISLSERYKIYSRIIPQIISIALVYQFYYEALYPVYSMFILYGLTLVISYFSNWKNREMISELEFNINILILSVFIATHFFLRNTSIYMNSYYFIFLLIVYYLMRRSGYDSRYRIFTISYAIVGLFSYYYHLDQYVNNIIQLMIISLIIFAISFIDDLKIAESIATSWLTISLPVVFGLTKISNHWILNGYLFEMTLFAFGSIYLMSKKELSVLWPYMFYIFGFLGRLIRYGDNVYLFEVVSIWNITVVSMYSLLGIFMIISTYIDKDWYTPIVSLFGWLGLGLLTINSAKNFDDYFIPENLWIIMQIGTLLSLVTIIAKSKEISSLDLISLSVIGLFNLILMSLIASDMKYILWLILLLTQIFVTYRLADQHSQTAVFIWLANISSNLIMFSFYNELTIDFMFIVLFLIMTTSNLNRLLFDMDDNQIINIIYFVMISILIYVFTYAEKIPVFQGILVYYTVTAIALTVSNRSDKKYSSLIFGAIFIMTSSIFMGFNKYNEYIIYVNWLVGLMVMIINSENILTAHTQRYVPQINYLSASTATINIMLVIVTAWHLINDRLINETVLNRWLAIIAFAVLILSIIIERIKNSNNLTDGMVISSFIILIVSSLIGFFSTATSNFILGSVAIGLALSGIILHDKKLFSIGMSVSSISLIKFIIDLIYIEKNMDRALSGMIIGIQAIFYAIVYSAYPKLENDTDNK